MMATEPTFAKPDAFLTDSAFAQSAVTSNEIQDASHSSATVNSTTSAEHKQIADVVNELVNSTEVSVSGSDTETSKADFPKQLGDKNHVRTSSTIKKPQSFKSVSVNRTFLAPKASTSSTSRPDSSPGTTSATPQPIHSNSASRLKLVAKSGSSLGGSTKTLSSNGKPAAAPDPNTVWNRNRPISQPEQKKLSDEELMQKFGIHMAGRLGPEDTKGQSNWADIEDDDEWAPETITWTDGTKITLPQADEAPPTPITVPATLHKEPAPLPPKSKSPTPTTSAVGSPSVKLGNLASGKSLVLKGAPEKPTLVAKPPALPTPAKSPWARLPPIEKVPPGQIDGPAAASALRPPAREHIPATSATPPPMTKEIAADDFSRSGFQDGHLNNHSQLFNSHSGRYEPVGDRRGSRNDIYGRQPAVLQRPQHHDQQGPAEPSAAFQTSRMSGQDVPYGRRRGSSNVSGTSGSLAHKLGRPHDMPPPPLESIQPHSGSIVAEGAESPISARTFSPANNQPTPRLQHNQPYQPRPSPGQTHVASLNSPTTGAPPTEDEIEFQKRVMHDRREQARKRRLEEEAREEEARQARIAEKLKALGPAPERKSAAKENKKDNSPALPAHGQQTGTPATMTTESGAAAKASGEPSNLTPTRGDTKPVSGKQVNGEAGRPLEQTGKHRNEMGHLANVPKPQSTTTPWADAPAPQQPDRFELGSWASSQNSIQNIWGGPKNNPSLGNGTFNPDLSTLPDSHPAPITERSHRPAPIGPPRSASQQPGRPESMSNGRLAPIGPPRGRHSNVSQTSEHAPANPWQSFATNVRDDDRRRALELQEKVDAQANQPTLQIRETWRSTDGVVREIKRGETMSKTVSNRNESRSSFKPHTADALSNPTRPSAQEAAELAKHSKGFMPTDFAVRDVARETISKQPAMNHSGPTTPGHPAQSRSSSRFFPSNTAHLRDTPSRDNYAQEEARTKSPTPPPPTADGHPVFDGDVTRPHVALPPARPIVKLPPSNNPSPVVSSAKPAPISFAAAAAAVPGRANAQPGVTRPTSRGVGYNGIAQKPHEIASQENWQDKINSLMGKKPAPPVRSVAVDSSSKIALDHSQFLDLATVALPVPSLSHSVSSLDSEDGDFTSKEMAEECFGEQEMGSLPAVRLPSETPDALWQAVEPDFDPAPMRLRIDATGAEAFRFLPEMSSGRIVIRIWNPLMFEAKTVLMPFSNFRSSSNPRRQGTRGGPRRLSGRTSQRGGREHNDHSDHASSSPGRPPSTRTGRGGYRPRTEHWSRHASAAPAAQS
ncbi:hypothetical protein F4818DRAFT_386248 [Hypoxylon cercidicola]|nr:hypothetical protein F4818DRAFT_386248 [Hypoxylon cercidicola]